jgi:polar amino acid transport system substrate-binding protein
MFERRHRMKRALVVIVLVLTLGLMSACAGVMGPPVINRIQQKGELVVGTAASMPPFNMTTKEGKIIGFEPDLAQSLASAMGVKLKLESMPFADLIPALEAGKIDMVMSSMTMLTERNMKVAFVGPYFISGKSLLTKTRTFLSVEDASQIDKPTTTLVALKGSTSQLFVEELIPKATLIRAKDYDEAVKMVVEGKAHAMVADYPICVISVFRYPDAELATLLTPLTYEPLGIALPANDSLLFNLVENFLEAFEGSGELEELRERWFENGSWLRKLP